MKIAYLTDIDLSSHSGVRIKHIMQCSNWEKLGHEVKIYSIPNTATVNAQQIDIPISFEVFDNKISTYFKGGIAAYVRKIFATSRIIKSLKEFNPDILYVRSMVYYPGLNRIVRSFISVIEYNTLMEKELEVAGNKRIRFMHGLGYKALNTSAKAFVGVTEEIALAYGDRYRRPAVAIGNGFDLSSYPLNEMPVNMPSPDRAQIVFVGSPNMPWHGIDKFYQLSTLVDADFHLVGATYEPDETSAARKNFIQHAFMNKKELGELYSKMDIAIGSLALHRNNLKEATPLKVREYCTYGLPIIIAYKDTDLSGKEFVLEIDNSEDTIEKNLLVIKAFISKWRGKRIAREEIEQLIDYRYKEEKRLSFLQAILKAERTA
ncbi:hypothetical protein FHW36_101254 [Chitinophaga polysaccharea]|uniref:Glycosyltransferase involved in cell wall biosynthesis n=1 Tax=Chitinophaga polysaccharea TaxID=1293035 RepID=A0A561Q1W5_9BACT|nr:glycosyltransferase family 4 protein [Chitinophaga polysaccharea]TWF44334.1 hypothetical protein FHW36_101254 [Chitinophaga polysaccharea]